MWESIGLGTLIELAMRGEYEMFGNHLRSPLCFDSMGSSLNILSSSSSSSSTTTSSSTSSAPSSSSSSSSSSSASRNRGMSAKRVQRVSVLHAPPMLGGSSLVAWRQAMPSKSQQEREARGAMGVHWKKGTHNPNERKWKTFEPEKE
jgi:hypothetical protein